MGDKTLPIKTKFMKAKCHVVHHFLTCILFIRKVSSGLLTNKEIVSMLMLTQNLPTNWVDRIINHMSYCRMIHSVGLPYGSLIIKILDNVGVNFEGEYVDVIHF